MDITDINSSKSVISDMSNIGFKSDSTGNKCKKLEKMWNDLSDDTGDFPNLDNMEKIYIEVASGMQLVTSLCVFQYLDSESIEDSFGWSKGYMLESRILVEYYWNVFCYVGKNKYFPL